MTAVIEPTDLETVEPEAPADGESLATSLVESQTPSTAPPAAAPDEPEPIPPANRRALTITMLSAAGAACMAGGMFGSWFARLLGIVAAALGVLWAEITLRTARRSLRVLAIGPILLVIGALSLAGSEFGPSGLPKAVREAVDAGRILRPPVPFDPGWRPVIIVIIGLLAFGAAYIGAAYNKPTVALAIPVPLLALTGMSQPKSGQLVAGLLGVIPLLAALALLYGNDLGGGGQKLTRQFELQRAVRSAGLVAAAIVALIVLNSTSFLFPKPAFDPDQAAQKPKSVPLSATEDRVLFEVQGPVTGPWKMGHLDVYDGKTWKLPPYSTKKLISVPSDGAIQEDVKDPSLEITFTVKGLSTSAVLPSLVDPARTDVKGDVAYEPRGGVLRQTSGRVPEGLVYKVARAPYPTAAQLKQTGPPGPEIPQSDLFVPKPPQSVSAILANAPQGPYDRLDLLLKELNKVVVAAGEGTPVDVTPATVERIFTGNHEASPYEIVAVQAMLARWAGLPARIGFGFDGVQEENGVRTIRPKNAAQWLEIHVDDGWVPIVTTPPKAKQNLDDQNTKKDPSILPSNDIGVEVLIPVKVVTAKQLYEKLRLWSLRILPFVFGLAALYAVAPAVERMWRRTRRRRWAATQGPAARIVVEYVEFRELATDLGVGHPTKTAIEFLDDVIDDEEHEELAWLVTRALYGDLSDGLSDAEAVAAEEMSASMRRRLRGGQPMQSRVLAFLTRTSLKEPHTREVPATRKPPKVRAARLPWRRRILRVIYWPVLVFRRLIRGVTRRVA